MNKYQTLCPWCNKSYRNWGAYSNHIHRAHSEKENTKTITPLLRRPRYLVDDDPTQISSSTDLIEKIIPSSEEWSEDIASNLEPAFAEMKHDEHEQSDTEYEEDEYDSDNETLVAQHPEQK